MERMEQLMRLKKILENDETKVVMVGKEFYAERILSYLEQNAIHVSDFFVDYPYEKVSNTYFDMCTKYNKFVVVIGFLSHGKSNLDQKLDALKCEQLVDVFDFGYPYPFGEEVFINNEFLESNQDALIEVYNYLADEPSKAVFKAFIKAKISGDNSYLDGLYTPNQYFQEDIFRLNRGEVIVDAGAYDGDTLCSLIDVVGFSDWEKYIAFEPDEEPAAKMESIVSERGLQGVTVIRKGVAQENKVMYLKTRFGKDSSLVESGDTSIQLCTIDSVVPDATLIKMDIEGAEMDALEGARKIIADRHPKLAICVYHKAQDIFQIPLWIHTISPEYKIYMRLHEANITRELVCYAVMK